MNADVSYNGALNLWNMMYAVLIGQPVCPLQALCYSGG
jgi:hypothetical protein